MIQESAFLPRIYLICALDLFSCLGFIFAQCYSVHCEAGVLGLCWEFPKLTCYGSYFVKIWHVSQFEQHFASLNANVIKLTRVESSPLAKPDLRVAKILAQTEVRS